MNKIEKKKKSLATMLRLPPEDVDYDLNSNQIVTKICYINDKSSKDLADIQVVSDRWGGTTAILCLEENEISSIKEYIQRGINTIYVIVKSYEFKKGLLHLYPISISEATNQWEEEYIPTQELNDNTLLNDERLVVYKRDPLKGFNRIPILTTNDKSLKDVHKILEKITSQNSRTNIEICKSSTTIPYIFLTTYNGQILMKV